MHGFDAREPEAVFNTSSAIPSQLFLFLGINVGNSMGCQRVAIFNGPAAFFHTLLEGRVLAIIQADLDVEEC